MKEIEHMLELNAKIQANIDLQTMLLQECLKIIREMNKDGGKNE
ncbi:hypothetical protein AB3Z07_05045 [Metabacillus halosaccharovorans]